MCSGEFDGHVIASLLCSDAVLMSPARPEHPLSDNTVGCYSFITWRISPLRSERCTSRSRARPAREGDAVR
jgi:hypothetical protein